MDPDWYTGFFEVDQTENKFTFDNDATLVKKIDYIFSIKLRTEAGFGVARVGCGAETASDHCFIHGYNRFVP